MGKRRFWLLKTEPSEWSWSDQRCSAGGVSRWDGVRNRQAQNNMKSMNRGDLCFFYHSGKDRQIVGVVEVVKTWYSDSRDNGDGSVDVSAVGEIRRAVDLREIKKEGGDVMRGFALLRQPRLSVVPVSEAIWERICEMGGGFTQEPPAPSPEEEEGEESGSLGTSGNDVLSEEVSLAALRGWRRRAFVSSKAVFGLPLEEYWTKKLQEEAAKEGDAAK